MECKSLKHCHDVIELFNDKARDDQSHDESLAFLHDLRVDNSETANTPIPLNAQLSELTLSEES